MGAPAVAPAAHDLEAGKGLPQAAQNSPLPHPAGYPSGAIPSSYPSGAIPSAYAMPPPPPGYYVAPAGAPAPLECGIGVQAVLFIVGFLCSPCWWAAIFIYLCGRRDTREKCAFVGNCIMTVVSIALLITVIVLLTTTYSSCSYYYGC